MKYEFSEVDIDFLNRALMYVALSLDGNAPDNSDLSEMDKLHVLGNCYGIQQVLIQEILNDADKKTE